ncbi:MAG: Hsp20 family protein [Gammaproteobacteria bacterium]|uniref:Hsp20 family protein n=1 Tax=Pseudomaricurvus alcaniphilus TaxID=1166482 RepID=UPI00140927BD|nr:Hsp20 family protein [Pseudomaricurvus alcaniphilus]MBR9911916.1 Hsp20 family protein [Gammaproteobacteria bacterium]NHN36033.1 Hsp20 family protein [Pseudomaricurvus alcaniphilus]
MRNTDFSPLYRTAIGFDRMANMLDNLSRAEQAQGGYPPYNIELLDENEYRITMALAGFTRAELNIETEQNTLKISGKKAEDSGARKFLHQGIAARNFERHFQLADHVKVENARLENGLLHVELVREIPEAMKPRTINIQTDAVLDGRTADARQGDSSDDSARTELPSQGSRVA